MVALGTAHVRALPSARPTALTLARSPGSSGKTDIPLTANGEATIAKLGLKITGPGSASLAMHSHLETPKC